MLPGFRFLFAAIVLSMSILVFGFGAAALLRTAHEEFANTPSWQPAPETRFAQSPPAPPPATQPVLAMLRVDDPPKDVSKEAATADQPASNDTVTTGAADQPAASAEPAPQPDKVAALQPVDATPPETAKPAPPISEAPATDSPPQAEAAPPPAAAEAPAAPDNATKLAATEPVPASALEAAPTAPAEAVAAAPEQPNAPSGTVTSAISTRIATLGGPPATIAPPVAKAASATSETSDLKKRQHARLELRRRNAARARLAKQAQALDLFGQPTTTAAATR
jgi:hypothetical protein